MASTATISNICYSSTNISTNNNDSNCINGVNNSNTKYSLPACQEYYVRRVQYLEQFRQQHGRDMRQRYVTLAKEIKVQSTERFLAQMGRLKTEMIDLMEKDVYLMRQLLALSDTVTELRLEDPLMVPLPSGNILTRSSSLSSSVPSLTTDDLDAIILPQTSATEADEKLIKTGADSGTLFRDGCPSSSSSPVAKFQGHSCLENRPGVYCSSDTFYIRSTEDLTQDSNGVSRRHAVLRIPIEPIFDCSSGKLGTLTECNNGHSCSSRPRRTLTCDSNGSSDGGSSTTSSSGVSSGGSRSAGTPDDLSSGSSSDGTLKSAGEAYASHGNDYGSLSATLTKLNSSNPCANCSDLTCSPYRTKFLLTGVSGGEGHCSKNCIRIPPQIAGTNGMSGGGSQTPRNCNQKEPSSIDSSSSPTRIILRKKSSSSSRKKAGKTTLMSFDDSDVSILTLTDPQEVFI